MISALFLGWFTVFSFFLSRMMFDSVCMCVCGAADQRMEKALLSFLSISCPISNPLLSRRRSAALKAMAVLQVSGIEPIEQS